MFSVDDTADLYLKARTHRDEFRARYSPTFNASWLNVSVHTDAKNATRKSIKKKKKNASGSFFWFDAPRQKLSDQWDWRFCSRVWSSWSYSKTQPGGAQTQNSLAEHTYVTTKKIYAK